MVNLRFISGDWEGFGGTPGEIWGAGIERQYFTLKINYVTLNFRYSLKDCILFIKKGSILIFLSMVF